MHTSWQDLDVRNSAGATITALLLVHFLSHESWGQAAGFSAFLFVAYLLTNATIAAARRHRAATAPTTTPQLHTKRGM